jgi:replicative DNA helicase
MHFENDIRSRAEQLVLAALLADNGCLRHLAGLLPVHFSHDTHGQLFRAITTLIAADKPASPESVASLLQRERKLRRLGVYPYLLALVKLPARPANVGYYALTLRNGINDR